MLFLMLTGLVSEKERVIKLSEQAKLYLEHEIDGNRQEIVRQSQHITTLEKEKDRYKINYNCVKPSLLGLGLINHIFTMVY